MLLQRPQFLLAAFVNKGQKNKMKQRPGQPSSVEAEKAEGFWVTSCHLHQGFAEMRIWLKQVT